MTERAPGDGVRVALLADHPAVVPLLRAWFEAEWAAYYGPGGPGDAAADLAACATGDDLPIGLAALEDGALRGAACLRASWEGSPRPLGPWLGGLLVAPEHRRRGIGSLLVAAAEDLARERGFPRLYAATATAHGLLRRRDWRPLEACAAAGAGGWIYVRELDGPGSPPVRSGRRRTRR